MLLDAVLGSPNLNWLTSEVEKVAHVATLNAPARATNTLDAQATTQSPRRWPSSSRRTWATTWPDRARVHDYIAGQRRGDFESPKRLSDSVHAPLPGRHFVNVIRPR